MNEFLKYIVNPTTIALVFGGILTSLFGVLAGISKSEQTPKWIAWCSFAAGLLVLGAGILSGYQDQLTAKKITELNNKIANTITGGNGYCFLIFMNRPGSNICDLMLISKGEYPLYDVEINIHDHTKRAALFTPSVDLYQSLPPEKFSELYNKSVKNSLKVIKIGNKVPHMARPLRPLILPKDGDKQFYYIEIFARNGFVIQFVHFRKVQGKWERAEKIIFNDKVVNKFASKNFPRDDAKKILGENSD